MKEKLQLISQKYKQEKENATNSYMPTNWDNLEEMNKFPEAYKTESGRNR